MPNHELSSIESLIQAQDAWESFFGRFFSPEIPKGVDVSFDADIRQFTPRKNQLSFYKSSIFTSQADQTSHSDDFEDFLNGHTIIIPKHIQLREQGLLQTKEAIDTGDYDHEAFAKVDHVFYALWLFKQNKITRQQMTTLLLRAQVPEEYPIVKTCPIFDEQGEPTAQAKELLCSILKNNKSAHSYTEEEQDRFWWLIKAAPKSEQHFFITKTCVESTDISLAKKSLAMALWHRYAWHTTTYQGQKYDLQFSLGIMDALHIAKRGIHGSAANRAKIGNISIDGVKGGIDENYRATAITVPFNPLIKKPNLIHGYKHTPDPVVSAHDMYHANLHNMIPPEFHMMLNQMVEIIRKHTKQKWSTTIWRMVDREFFIFQNQKLTLDSSKAGAAYFMDMFHSTNYPDMAFLFKQSNLLELSEAGFAIVWHMVNEPEVWKKLYKVDIDSLRAPYPKLIEEITSFKTVIGEASQDSAEWLTLKYRLFRVVSADKFKKMSRLLDDLKSQLSHDHSFSLVFQKAKKWVQDGDRWNYRNLIGLICQSREGCVEISEMNVKQLIPYFVSEVLCSQLGEQHMEAVQSQLDHITPEFKSIHQNSQFTKALLDEYLAPLPTRFAKLTFLEECYQSIKTSAGYLRRRPLLDDALGFFRNPLTTSQRKHIHLLKQAFSKLIEEYQQERGLNEEAIAQLQWYLQTLDFKLPRCRTERFIEYFDKTSDLDLQTSSLA